MVPPHLLHVRKPSNEINRFEEGSVNSVISVRLRSEEKRNMKTILNTFSKSWWEGQGKILISGFGLLCSALPPEKRSYSTNLEDEDLFARMVIMVFIDVFKGRSSKIKHGIMNVLQISKFGALF